MFNLTWVSTAVDATGKSVDGQTFYEDCHFNSAAALDPTTISNIAAFTPTCNISNIYFHYDILKISPVHKK